MPLSAQGARVLVGFFVAESRSPVAAGEVPSSAIPGCGLQPPAQQHSERYLAPQPSIDARPSRGYPDLRSDGATRDNAIEDSDANNFLVLRRPNSNVLG